MHVVRNIRVSGQRKMYLPSERMVVNGVGLGEVDGFNIGKMFNRMFTFRKGSFKPGNIMGAIGSAVSFVGTAGLSSALAPKTFSAHSSVMKKVGMGVSAAAATVGAAYGAGALAGGTGGFLSTVGTGVSVIGKGALAVGKGILSVGKDVISVAGSVLGNKGSSGGGGGSAGPTQAEYDAYLQQQATYAAQQAQAMRDAQAAAQNVQQQQLIQDQLSPTLYPTMDTVGQPGSYGPFPIGTQVPAVYSPLADARMREYIDPETGLITDPETGDGIDPATGKVVQSEGVQISPTTILVAAGSAAVILWAITSKD